MTFHTCPIVCVGHFTPAGKPSPTVSVGHYTSARKHGPAVPAGYLTQARKHMLENLVSPTVPVGPFTHELGCLAQLFPVNIVNISHTLERLAQLFPMNVSDNHFQCLAPLSHISHRLGCLAQPFPMNISHTGMTGPTLPDKRITGWDAWPKCSQ